MGMARINLPSVFVYGGTILPGMWNGKAVTVQDVYEAVGAFDAGKMTIDEQLAGKCSRPSAGSCGGMYTATQWHVLVRHWGSLCREALSTR